MAQLVYTEEELFADHDYARPQLIAGRRCHGGFDCRSGTARLTPPGLYSCSSASKTRSLGAP